METKPLRLWDRSRTTTDWVCPRKRFWQYEYGGRGVVTAGTSLELFMGTVVHDCMAAIATSYQNGTSLDVPELARRAYQELYNNLTSMENPTQDDVEYAKEQGTLIQGLILGFYKHAWPRIIAEYPEVLVVEAEMQKTEVADQDNKRPRLLFMSKPDVIVRSPAGLVAYLEYKTTSSKKPEWINSWETAVQLHSTIKAVKETTGLDVDHVVVQGLYKGYECLVPKTPVLTADLQWKPVGDLVVGERLAAFEEHPGNNRSGGKSLREWREAQVTGTGRRNLPCYRVVLEDGTEFTCSSNHLWLTAWKAEGMGSAVWRRTDQLTTKHRIVKIIQPWSGTGEIDSYDAGYLAAAFDGEGSLSTMQFDANGKEYYSLALQFTQNPNGMQQYMKDVLEKYGITYSLNKRGDSHKAQDIQLYGKIKVLSLLGKVRPKRLLPKLNFNRLGMIKDLPVRPVKVVSVEFVGDQEVVTLSTSTETFIADGFASHNSYGKQSSPMCYYYKRQGSASFVKGEVSYEYKAGMRRHPVWELPGGVEQWVASMPETILAEQFPRTPPIFFNETLVDAFFRQRELREHAIAQGVELLDKYQDTPEMVQFIMDETFSQRFDQCTPGYGKGRACEYKPLCHGGVEDPFSRDYIWREPHHALEAEMLASPPGSLEERSSNA